MVILEFLEKEKVDVVKNRFEARFQEEMCRNEHLVSHSNVSYTSVNATINGSVEL